MDFSGPAVTGGDVNCSHKDRLFLGWYFFAMSFGGLQLERDGFRDHVQSLGNGFALGDAARKGGDKGGIAAFWVWK